MSVSDRSPKPSVISMGPQSPEGGRHYEWHRHPFDELCLVAAGRTVIGHAGAQHATPAGTLYLFRRGERHGYWNAPAQGCRMLVLHFDSGDDAYHDAPDLCAADPLRRIWRLTADQTDAYEKLFNHVLTEHALGRAGAASATSAYLRLLLVSVVRLREKMPAPAAAPADVLAMLHLAEQHDGDAATLLRVLRDTFPNYDSLRHRFSTTVGESPSSTWRRARMRRATNLLLGTDLSVKEIAARVGYARQHEFTRAFARAVGVSPTAWRRRHVT